jgi:hypothetical protein
MTDGRFLLHLATVLLETVVIEAAVLLLIRRDGKWLFPCLLGNLLTNPLLNLVYGWVFFRTSPALSALCLLALEACAVLYEAFLYDGLLLCGKRDALRVSLLCNAVSFGTGLLVDLLS